MAESHVIDERSEWRNFGDKVSCILLHKPQNAGSTSVMASMPYSTWQMHLQEKGDHGDPSRVGGPTNHLLSDGGLGTEIGVATKGTGNMTMIRNLQRTAARASDPDHTLKRAYAHINKLCGALGLQKDASSRACEIFKKASEHPKGLKGKSTSAMCAAVVYVACR